MDYLGVFLLSLPFVLTFAIIIRWLYLDFTAHERNRRERRWRIEEQQAKLNQQLAEKDALEQQFRLPSHQGEDR